MIVVADSSPLHYLILLEQTELLHRLYEEVAIPDAVVAELRRRIASEDPRVAFNAALVAQSGRGHFRRHRVGV